MKIEWKNCFIIGICIFILFLCMRYWQTAVNIVSLIIGAASPLILGCIIAYMVNILMSFYEKQFFKKIKSKFVIKIKRPICMIAAFLTLALLISFILFMIVPELVACIEVLIAKLPKAIEDLIDNGKLIELLPKDISSFIEQIDWSNIVSKVSEFLFSGIGNVTGTVTTVISSVFSTVVTLVIGFIFSVYLLLGKDKLKRQTSKLMNHYLNAKWREHVLYVVSVLNENFRQFIVGQCIEAVILGCLCALGMLIFRFPYAIMIGVLIGFTALIPVAGAYIGAITGAFMILTVSPQKSLLFIIYIVVLQQIEGNLIYPRVVGKSIGLPAIWVLAAVTIGGGLGGVVGMLLGVPLAASVYQFLCDDMKKERHKKISERINE